MTYLRNDQIPKTITHKGRRYKFKMRWGERSAIFIWHGNLIMVEFTPEKKRKQDILCEMEEDETKIMGKDG